MSDSFFIAGDKVADWRLISYTASFGNMFHILHRYMKVWCEGSWSNCLKADINETALRWYSNWILVFGFASVVLGGDLWRTKIMESLPQSLEFPNAIPRSISVSSFPNSFIVKITKSSVFKHTLLFYSSMNGCCRELTCLA